MAAGSVGANRGRPKTAGAVRTSGSLSPAAPAPPPDVLLTAARAPAPPGQERAAAPRPAPGPAARRAASGPFSVSAHRLPFQLHFFPELLHFHFQFVLLAQVLDVDGWHRLHYRSAQGVRTKGYVWAARAPGPEPPSGGGAVGRPPPARPRLALTLPPELPRCSAAASSPARLHPCPAPLRPLNLHANPL